MSFKGKVKSTLQEQGTALIWGALSFLLFAVVRELAKALPDGWIEKLPSKPILLVLLLSLLVNLLLAWLLVSSLKEEPLALKHGVYWDKASNARCPACRTPMNRRFERSFIGYHCIKCDRTIWPVDEHGNGFMYSPSTDADKSVMC